MKNVLCSLLLLALVAVLPGWAQNQDEATGKSSTTTQDNATPKTQDQAAAGSRHTESDRSSGNQEKSEVVRRLDEAAADLNRLTSAEDNNIPQSILSDAKCIAIVPKLIKGGFVFGGQHGRGVATCRVAKKGWSAPAFFVITGGSWGAQIGVEGVDLVMLFMNDEGANKLLASEWKIGADAGIAAGPFGRDVSANTSWKMDAGILTYSRAKGVFAGATLNGANVRADMDSTRAFYGRPYKFRAILTGQVTPPVEARPFLAQIRQNFREANAAK